MKEARLTVINCRENIKLDWDWQRVSEFLVYDFDDGMVGKNTINVLDSFEMLYWADLA